jgi:hypothetical protein
MRNIQLLNVPIAECNDDAYDLSPKKQETRPPKKQETRRHRARPPDVLLETPLLLSKRR